MAMLVDNTIASRSWRWLKLTSPFKFLESSCFSILVLQNTRKKIHKHKLFNI